MIGLRHVLAIAACCASTLCAAAASDPADLAGNARAPRMDAVARCSWERPGHNPFVGEVVPAIDRYVDIPTPVRVRLKQRMAARRYDELVEIRRDSIRGRHEYRPEIRDMHFGLDRVCREVTRSSWTDAMRERGLVYCDSGHCILVPTVCRNVSRVERVAPAGVAAEPAAATTGVPAQAPASAAPDPADAAAPVPPGPSFAEAVAAADAPLWPADLSGAEDIIVDAPLLPPLDDAADPPATERPPGGGPIFGGPIFGTPVTGGGSSAGPTAEASPVSPVPEPATWVSLLAGLGLLAWLNAARQRRCGAPRCATQKRS